MNTYTVAELLKNDLTFQQVGIKGWVRTFRANRFIALNDGSTINNIQCVVDFETTDESVLKKNNDRSSCSHKRRIGKKPR